MLRDQLRRLCFPDEAYHQDAFHRAIVERLPERGKVLDLGCGDHTALAGYRTSAREVWGCDFQQHPALAHPRWFRLMTADGEIPFGDASFDLVACDWVLEHVAQPRPFLREVCRVLRPGAAFAAHSISGAHYLTWVRRLFDLVPHEVVQEIVHRLYGRRHHDTFPTRYRLNTPGQIAAAAGAAGLCVERLEFFAVQDYFNFSQPLYCAAVLADRLLEFLGRGLGRIYFVAVLRKAPPGSRTAEASGG